MIKTKYHPCNVCGEDAIACLSPDLDIKGFCYCKEHEEEVRIVYIMIMSGTDSKIVENRIKNWKTK